MPIKATYNITELRRELRQFAQNINDDIIKSMQQAGEKFVRDARNMSKSQGGFGDVTGNLRSSIGYLIRKERTIIESNFKGNSFGLSEAERAVEELPISSGYQLVGMAGMDYASYVESRGLNVITFQGENMLVDLDHYLKALENKYK